MNLEIAFVGAGKMVSAIVQGLLRTQTFRPSQIGCCSAKDGTSEKLSLATDIIRFDDLDAMLAENPQTLVLGCKPQQLAELPQSIAEKTANCLVLSIMAGVTTSRLHQSFPEAKNVVRSMPNTPGQIGAGATGYFFMKIPEESEMKIIRNILSALGKIYPMEQESDLDRVTAISGSGPAYVFEFTCALEEAAKRIGLDSWIARELALQTVFGSAKLMETSVLSPAELREQVTSPNGTTQAALETFSSDQLREIIYRAAVAACKRSIEFSNA